MQKITHLIYLCLLTLSVYSCSTDDTDISDSTTDTNITDSSATDNTDDDTSAPTELPDSITIMQTVEGKDISRVVLINSPSTLTKTDYPVVFYLHGHGGNPYDMQMIKEIQDLVKADEFIALFPEGYQNSWNCGQEASKADEIAFFNSIIDELEKYPFLDLTKVYGVGFSNGGLMTNKLGKETSIFRGIAPIISQQSVEGEALTPKRNLSVYQIGGDSDGLIPIDGGASATGHTFVSAKESAEDWASHLSCTMTAVETTDTWGTFPVKSFSYKDCNDGHEVQYHVVEGAAHVTSFGKDDPLHTRIWEFFKAH